MSQDSSARVWLTAQDRFVQFTDGLVGVLLAVIVALTTVQIGGRYIFNLGLPWINEITRFLFIWLVMVGAGAASARGAHVGFDLVLYRLRGRTRAVVQMVVACASAMFLALLAFEGMRLVGLNRGQRSPVLDLPMSIIFISVPLGALLCLAGAFLGYLSGKRPSSPGDEI